MIREEDAKGRRVGILVWGKAQGEGPTQNKVSRIMG